MDYDIKKENKIPNGCESFTRPEEISSLKKYLRARYDEVDAITEIGDKRIGVIGFKDNSQIKKVSTLPGDVEVLRTDGKGVSALVNQKEWLDNEKNLDLVLSKKRDNLLEDNNSPTKLNTTRSNLLGNENQPTTLREGGEGLPGNFNNPATLDNSLESLVENENQPTTLREKLIERPENNNNPESLGDTLISRPENNNNPESLGNTLIERPENNNNPESLGNTLISKPENENNPVELGSILSNIPESEQNIEKLNDSRLKILPTEGKEVLGLTDTAQGLPENEGNEVELGDTRLDINPNKLEDLGAELSSIIQSENNEPIKLGDTTKEIPENEEKNVGLGETRLDINIENPIDELGETLITSPESENGEIEGLGDKILSISSNEHTQPEDLLEEIIKKPENFGGTANELEDTRIDINPEPTPTNDLYPDLIEKPENEGGTADSLEDTRINITSNDGGTADTLEDLLIDLLDNEGSEVSDLSDTILGITPDQNNPREVRGADHPENTFPLDNDYRGTHNDSRVSLTENFNDTPKVRGANFPDTEFELVDQLRDKTNDSLVSRSEDENSTRNVRGANDPNTTFSLENDIRTSDNDSLVSRSSDENSTRNVRGANDPNTIFSLENDIRNSKNDSLVSRSEDENSTRNVRGANDPNTTFSLENDIRNSKNDSLVSRSSDENKDYIVRGASDPNITFSLEDNIRDSKNDSLVSRGSDENSTRNVRGANDINTTFSLEDNIRNSKNDSLVSRSSDENSTRNVRGASDINTTFSLEDNIRDSKNDSLVSRSEDENKDYIVRGAGDPNITFSLEDNIRTGENDSLVSRSEDESTESNTKQSLAEEDSFNKHRSGTLSTVLTNEHQEISSIRDSDDQKYYINLLHFIDNLEGLDRGWRTKMLGLANTYLMGTGKISGNRIKEYQTQLYNAAITYYEEEGQIKVSRYKLPENTENPININNYLRYLAEETLGISSVTGSARRMLLDETLALLCVARQKVEKLTKSNRDRLPGSEDGGLVGDIISGGLSSLGSYKSIKRVTDAIFGNDQLADTSVPRNRPSSDPNKETTGWELLNAKDEEGLGNGGEVGSTKSLGQRLLSAAVGSIFGESDSNKSEGYFKTRYLNGLGIATTLEDLCGVVASSVYSVEDLMDSIKNSPYINSPLKFTSSADNIFKVSTLDVNNRWEIIFYPYCGPENGGFSYLPAIEEINENNYTVHGVKTRYSKWLPVTSFELSKTKMNSKTVSLFDGEISYPVSMEYTNEFRLTFVDDQYKSWRNYFEKCIKACIYNSTAHNADYYTRDWHSTLGGSNVSITQIDEDNPIVSLYKNVTFRCIIYCLTPQLSTINKYDLLLTIRDFSEIRTGDVEGGGDDLTVIFSVVGENPIGTSNEYGTKSIAVQTDTYRKQVGNHGIIDATTQEQNKTTSSNSISSIIAGGVSKIIGVL